jgi:hypothetical protein
MGSISMLRISVDGHFHGGPPPRPWVARIDGPDERYGLQREFVSPLNDWAEARKAWSGNLYGVVACFPLRDGHLYEVSRCRGKPSKRYVSREFFLLDRGKQKPLDALEALALVEGHQDPVTILRVPDDPADRPWVAEVSGLGTPRRLGFVVVNGQRVFRLRHGRIYEVYREGSRHLLGAGPSLKILSQKEAQAWLT